MDLAIAKLGCLLDEEIDIFVLGYVSCNGDCIAAFGFDGFDYCSGLCCSLLSARSCSVLRWRNVNTQV